VSLKLSSSLCSWWRVGRVADSVVFPSAFGIIDYPAGRTEVQWTIRLETRIRFPLGLHRGLIWGYKFAICAFRKGLILDNLYSLAL